MLVLDTSGVEPVWLAVLGRTILLLAALFFLDVAITGGLGLFALAWFLTGRESAGWYRVVGHVLGVGALVALVVFSDKRAALRAGTPYQPIDSLLYLGALAAVGAIYYLFFFRGRK